MMALESQEGNIMKVKLDIISTFINVLEDAYQNMKASELNQENINMTKELISRCLEHDAFRFYSDIFNSETKETETCSDDNTDNFTDIKDEQDFGIVSLDNSLRNQTDNVIAEPLENDDKYKYRYIDNRKANRRVISDKTFSVIDDVIANTKTLKETLAVLHAKGIDVSYSTVHRRKQLMFDKDSISNSCKSYTIKATNAFNEMKDMGCKEYNGNIYYADGTPVSTIFSTSFVKCTVWDGVRIPTKYIVAMYNGYAVNEDISIWHGNDDPRDTRIENLVITNDASTPQKKKLRNKVEIENICKIFTEEKGDSLKIWQRCVDELGDFVSAALISSLRTKRSFSNISDKYFTASDVKQWYNDGIYLSTIDLTPKDNYTGDDAKYAEMLEKYAFTNKEIPFKDKEFILKNLLKQEYGMDELLFEDATDLKYTIDSIRNKLKDKGINISAGYIRGIININGGGIKLGG